MKERKKIIFKKNYTEIIDQLCIIYFNIFYIGVCK